MYTVYMLRCRGNVLYTGITPDFPSRLKAHLGLKPGGAKFTHSFPPKSVAAVWEVPNRRDAASLEAKIKRLSRAKKDALAADPSSLAALIPIPSAEKARALPVRSLEDYLTDSD